MRILVWCLAMLLLGGVVGGLITSAEFSGLNDTFEPNSDVLNSHTEAGISDAMRESGKALPPTEGARVEVTGGEVHDFGHMEIGGTGTYKFHIRNVGEKVMKLDSGGTSCQACTISTLERKQLQPGEGTDITVNWVVKTQDLDFRKEAYILTNDPARPTVILVIKGKAIKSVRLEEDEIKLGDVSATEGRVGKCRVYCFRADKFEIVSSTLANAESADKFTLDVRPLTDEELATRDGALQGYEVSVSAKPGLPLGSIIQTIRLESNWDDVRKIEIPIRGNVVSDISIIGGKNFDSAGNVFRFDVVPRHEGRKAQAQIAIKGAERHEAKFEVGEIDPAGSLKVTLGEPKEVNNGAVVLIPLTVEVLADSPPVSRLGGTNRKDFGRIVIKTTHSASKELQLLVRFAVE